MTINCAKQELLDALTLVGRAVPVRTTMPILECVLLTAEGEGLTLMANNMEICIKASPIPAHVEVAGSIALDAKLLTDIVRKMPGDAIFIEADERGNAEVRGGRSRVKIGGQPANEFPDMPEDEKTGSMYSMDAVKLRDMIKGTIFSVAQDQTKLILTGELLNIENGMLQMVAIDMFRISFAAQALGDDCPAAKAVVPGKALAELSRILPADDEAKVQFCFTDKKAVFEAGTFTLVTSILTGDFIRYDQIFNEDFTTMVLVEREALLGAFERAVIMAVENRMLPIKIEIKDDDLTVSAESDRGTVVDGVPCETEGQDLTIYFNPRYFIEALRAIEDERIVLKLNTVLSPCSIRGAENDAFKYLIVPLRPPQ